MNVLISGIAIISLSFIIHFLIWKIRLPARQGKAILFIFGCTTVLFLATSIFFAATSMNTGKYLPVSIIDFMHVILFVASVTMAYIITYTAIEADSPSLVMVQVIAEKGEKGLESDVFNSLMTDEILVIPRVKDIIRDKMAYIEKEKYHLTSKGNFMAKLFIIFRSLLDAQKGG